MASKLIRDDMLDSERVHKVSVPARWLYVSILLLADDVGLFEVNHFKLGRYAGLDQTALQSLLDELAAQDLIRAYKVGSTAYGFVPRYRQRLQIKRAKHPLPPIEFLDGDDDAISKIKYLAEIPRMDTVQHGNPPSEPEPEPEPKEIKRPRSVDKQRTAPPAPKKPRKPSAPKAPTHEIVAVFHEVLPELPGVKLMPVKRLAALQKFWEWVLSSKKPDGTPRATNPEEALAWVRVYFDRVRANDFLMGRGKRSEEHAGWRCSLDFLLTEKGMLHVIERTETS